MIDITSPYSIGVNRGVPLRELLRDNPPRTTPYNLVSFDNGIVTSDPVEPADGARGPLGLPLLLGGTPDGR